MYRWARARGRRSRRGRRGRRNRRGRRESCWAVAGGVAVLVEQHAMVVELGIARRRRWHYRPGGRQ